MGKSTFSGPLRVGSGDDAGTALTAKMSTMTQNGANNVSVTITVPEGASIMDAYFDVTEAWNSGTSATGSIGTTAGGTQYGGSVNLKTAARGTPTYSNAQLAAMANVGSNTNVVFTSTVSGATSAGSARCVVRYMMN